MKLLIAPGHVTVSCDLSSASNPPAAKKRKSRWGTEDRRTILPGLPTVLPSNMKEEEQKLYLCERLLPLRGSSSDSVFLFFCHTVHLKIEENSRMLRTGDLGIPVNPADRYCCSGNKPQYTGIHLNGGTRNPFVASFPPSLSPNLNV